MCTVHTVYQEAASLWWAGGFLYALLFSSLRTARALEPTPTSPHPPAPAHWHPPRLFYPYFLSCKNAPVCNIRIPVRTAYSRATLPVHHPRNTSQKPRKISRLLRCLCIPAIGKCTQNRKYIGTKKIKVQRETRDRSRNVTRALMRACYPPSPAREERTLVCKTEQGAGLLIRVSGCHFRLTAMLR